MFTHGQPVLACSCISYLYPNKHAEELVRKTQANAAFKEKIGLFLLNLSLLHILYYNTVLPHNKVLLTGVRDKKNCGYKGTKETLRPKFRDSTYRISSKFGPEQQLYFLFKCLIKTNWFPYLY